MKLPELQQLVQQSTLDFLIASIFCYLAALVIGGDRERRGKSAGVSTYSFVIGGSMMFSFVGNVMGVDPTRIAAQIVTGIGFLGAGLIIRQSGTKVSNLTTAASVWYSSALGVAIGFHLYTIAAIGVLYAWVAFKYLPKFKSPEEEKSS